MCNKNKTFRLHLILCICFCAAWAVGCDDDEPNKGSSSTGTSATAGTNTGSSSTTSSTTDTSTSSTTCEDGETRCLNEGSVERCEEGEWVFSEDCPAGLLCSTGRCVPQQDCDPGVVNGCWDDHAQNVCNGEGSSFERRECADGLRCLRGECTDAVCIPETRNCLDSDTVEVCDADGQGYTVLETCGEGSTCSGGVCLSGCDLSKKQPSYIGCQYWSVDLDNYPDPIGDPPSVPHAVAISNPGNREAVVNITTRNQTVTLDPATFTVPPNSVEVYTFPRLDVDGSGITDHSFFLESSWPVVAYQFNPLNNEGVFSNDASLLLPSESLGSEYIAVSWPTTPIGAIIPNTPSQHGYVTIVATRPGVTDVTVKVSANVSASVDNFNGRAISFIPEGEEAYFTLNRFEVLNLQADGTELFPIQDLTGSIITATQPIAVFGGHEEAVVSDPNADDSCCAEHLEQQLFPVGSWGTRYLAAQSEPRGGGFSGDVWRIVAAYDNTLIQTVPPQPDANNAILNRGEWIEVMTGDSFEVIGDQPIMVVQYLKSRDNTNAFIGDPAMILAVPVEQFRDNYTILTPEGYTSNWVTVMRAAGVEVTQDGQPVPDASFTAFGDGSYEFAWVSVQEGAHTFASAQPFGLSAYGFSAAVSYGYPGGLNLRIPDEEEEEAE